MSSYWTNILPFNFIIRMIQMFIRKLTDAAQQIWYFICIRYAWNKICLNPTWYSTGFPYSLICRTEPVLCITHNCNIAFYTHFFSSAQTHASKKSHTRHMHLFLIQLIFLKNIMHLQLCKAHNYFMKHRSYFFN